MQAHIYVHTITTLISAAALNYFHMIFGETVLSNI